jgi:hypothetical protein
VPDCRARHIPTVAHRNRSVVQAEHVQCRCSGEVWNDARRPHGDGFQRTDLARQPTSDSHEPAKLGLLRRSVGSNHLRTGRVRPHDGPSGASEHPHDSDADDDPSRLAGVHRDRSEAGRGQDRSERQQRDQQPVLEVVASDNGDIDQVAEHGERQPHLLRPPVRASKQPDTAHDGERGRQVEQALSPPHQEIVRPPAQLNSLHLRMERVREDLPILEDPEEQLPENKGGGAEGMDRERAQRARALCEDGAEDPGQERKEHAFRTRQGRDSECDAGQGNSARPGRAEAHPGPEGETESTREQAGVHGLDRPQCERAIQGDEGDRQQREHPRQQCSGRSPGEPHGADSEQDPDCPSEKQRLDGQEMPQRQEERPGQ